MNEYQKARTLFTTLMRAAVEDKLDAALLAKLADAEKAMNLVRPEGYSERRAWQDLAKEQIGWGE